MNTISDATSAYYAQVGLVLKLLEDIDPDMPVKEVISALKNGELELHAMYKQSQSGMKGLFMATLDGKAAQMQSDISSGNYSIN